MTVGAINKISNLIEGISNYDTYVDKFLNMFKYSHFKNLSDEEFETLIKILRDWYYHAIPFETQIQKNKIELPKLLKKITNVQTNHPPYIYRALSFQSKTDFDQVVKELNKGIIQRNNSEYTSWTSSKKIAYSFLPGGDYTLNNKYSKYGILIKLPKGIYKDKILFTTEGLFKSDKEKLDFLKILLVYTHKKNLKMITAANSIKHINQSDFFGAAHGGFYAAEENEYILEKIITDQKIDFKTITPNREQQSGSK